MKAIEINGKIKVYNSLPNSWKGVMGNFSKLSDEEIKEYGFYNVIIPEYDIVTQQLGDIYFDKNVFTYPINEKNIPETLEELKQKKITQLKDSTRFKLSNTDWYITRKTEKNIDIPESITTERDVIRTQADTKEVEINALTEKANVIKYEFE